MAVSYDPSSADYAISNSILKLSVLDKYAVPGGVGNIPYREIRPGQATWLYWLLCMLLRRKSIIGPGKPITWRLITMIGYNPYLEAGFGPADLNFPNALNPSYKFGIQTNCMSCHTLATIDGLVGYCADQYISNSDTIFKNQVRLDFAWSIQQAIIKDKK